MLKKSLPLLAALLLLFSALSWAEGCLTDAEVDELDQIFATLDGQLKQQEISLLKLDSELTTAREQLSEAKKLQTTSETIIKTLKGQLNAAEISLQRQEREALAAIIGSAATGLVVGLVLGLIL